MNQYKITVSNCDAEDTKYSFCVWARDEDQARNMAWMKLAEKGEGELVRIDWEH